MNKLFVAAAVMTLAGLETAAMAANVEAGRSKYANPCMGCHGPMGEGNDALKYPRLAGRDAAYIKQNLMAYRDGGKVNPTMNAMAAALTDAQIDNLAAYIATFR